MAWQIAFVPVYLVGSSLKQPKHPPGVHPSGKSPASKEQRYGQWMFAGRGGKRKGGRERKREFHPVIRSQTSFGQHPKRTWACLEDSPWVCTLSQSQPLHNRRTSYLNVKEYLILAAIWMDLEIIITRASLVAQMVKNLPTMQETQVQPLGWEDPLEKGMATHSSSLAWRIAWIEEPGGLQSIGCEESEMTKWLSAYTHTHLKGQCCKTKTSKLSPFLLSSCYFFFL